MICSRQLRQWGLGGCVFGALLLPGCRYGAHPEQGTAAYVRLINAVPDAGGLDVSVDGKRVWRRSEFRSSTGYQTIQSGTYPIKIDASGIGTTLLTESLLFEKRQNYTLLALGQAGSNGSQARVQALRDEKPAHIADGKSLVRLINASPGAPAIDLVVNTIVGVKSVTYGHRSSPLTLSSGHYELQLAAADTAKMLVGPVSLELESGQSYTLIAMGRTTNQTLTLEAYPDKGN